MKSKLTKYIKKVCYLLVILFIGFFSIFQYLKYDFNKHLDQKTFENVILEVQKAEPLPENFINLYEQIHPITNINGLLYDSLREKYDRRCPCRSLSFLTYSPREGFIRHQHSLDIYFHTKKLEKKVSQKACLNAYINTFDFLFNTKGIKDASKYYFDKEPSTLNEEEMITMILMLQNPRRYNPKRSVSQKTLATKIIEIKEKIANQKEY
ncbi:hypothetical protein GCM10011344_36690 [Dokdonia pacifica]|uniref:Transglycosylase n=1 Tax=Dokdonia pacifica TaxID=1627892 RepID=A0A239B044_9FLAO|nr:transglycosylase domain-containing protein [Dokdonia pacifica]GGG32426.1 hypothetical protein GCM10011344_36690 [Dokdonia pacifica]SNS00583.1 Transglycosylase [Dokdonia pacifica]